MSKEISSPSRTPNWPDPVRPRDRGTASGDIADRFFHLAVIC